MKQNKKEAVSASRTFDEIPIWFPGVYRGFGDVAVTLKLAEGLKREFPDKKITAYFGNDESYTKVRNLYPDFNPRELEYKLNGINVARISNETMRLITSRNLVGIFSPIPAGGVVSPIFAAINFYIQEYDCSDSIRSGLLIFGDNIQYNHKIPTILPTGFEKDSIGIHIDPDLSRLQTEPTASIKKELLEKAGLEELINVLPDITNLKWGFAYSADALKFRRHGAFYDFLSILDNHLKINDMGQGVAIFDFSAESLNAAMWNVFDSFVDIFAENPKFSLKESIRTKLDKSSIRKKRKAYLIHVGTKEHSVFLDFLRYSQLPPLVTGDASLSEAISLDKVFFYDAPHWKREVLPHFVDRAKKMLKGKDAGIIEKLFLEPCSMPYCCGTCTKCTRWQTRLARLFYDEKYQTSFLSYNQAIRDKMDISKNLAKLIRKSVRNYNQ